MKQYENILLVTGGAGFIGSAFLRMLVPKYPNWYFINLDALTYAGDLRKVESVQDYENYVFVHGNICNRTVVESLFDKYKINIVVNFAAESHVDNSIKDAESFIETNIKGTYNLLEVAKNKWGYNGSAKFSSNYLFLQISTDEVYGSLGPNDAPWKEEEKIAPNSPYSASKASSELLAISYYKTHALPVIITRSSNNYGPYQNEEKLIPKIMINSFNNLPIPIYGSGSNVRDWIFVDDNINALEIIILRGVLGQTYNISSRKEIKNLDLAHYIMGLVLNTKSIIKYVDDRLGHDFRYSIKNDKLISLGWAPLTDFENGILITLAHYEKSK